MLTFDHVAIAVRRILDAEPFLRDLLGGTPGERGTGNGFTFQQYAFPGGVVELLEPRGEDSFLVRFLRDRGEGLHHITFKVAGLRAWADKLRSAGYRVVGENYDNPAWRELFVHPKSGHGVLIQLAETLADGAPE
ncbi:MAG TPA: VOC family protein [bacterium]|nr:VOC family protein [bacterium]